MLRQSLNQVEIKGILEEVNLEIRNDRSGREYIGGTVTFLVNQTVDGAAEQEHVKVSVFQYPTTKKGAANKAFESAKNLLENGVSIAACGDPAQADQYTVSGANLTTNTFPSRDGKDITYPLIRASFFNKATRQIDPIAAFEQEIVVAKMEPEIVNDTETGRLMIKGVCIGYNENPDSFTYFVENQNAIDYINSNWMEEDTVKISGLIRMITKTKEVTESDEDIGFGTPTVKTFEQTVKEFIITAGSAGCLGDEKKYDVDEVMRAIENKKSAYEANKTSTPAPAAPTARPAGRMRGF